jgi:hypothetical protein
MPEHNTYGSSSDSRGRRLLRIGFGRPRSRQQGGRALTARQIVTGAPITVPEWGRHLVNVLEKAAARNESKKPTID